MRRALAILFATSLFAALWAAPGKAAEPGACEPPVPVFGLCELALSLEEEGGAPATMAGSHPYSFTVTLDVNTKEDPTFGKIPVDTVKDLEISLPPGLLADRSAVKTCPVAVFLASADNHHQKCSNDTVVGVTRVTVGTEGPNDSFSSVYNMTAPRGAVLKFGFIALGVPVTFDAGLATSPPYNGVVRVNNIPQAVNFYGSKTTVWGYPGDKRHDPLRGTCLDGSTGESKGSSCPVDGSGRPFMTLPRSCSGPLSTTFRARSWQNPGTWLTQGVGSAGIEDCPSLPFGPKIEASLSSSRVSSPTGMAFDLNVTDEGLTSPTGRAASDILGSKVILPTGVTINPSQAEGLAVCSEAEIAREGPDTPFGSGCPPASKIGSVEAESPLVEGEILHGSLFVAEPYANPFGSLIALYISIADPAIGVFVNQPLKVVPDLGTGQLIATTENMPQLPLSHVRLRFREGGRSPLISPPGCGSFPTEASFFPWADPASASPASSSFEINQGVNGGPCPRGPAPFHPGFDAGTLSNQAGSFSPFVMRVTRGDGEQDMGRFSFVLPPGVVPKLAGIPYCSDAGIARAASRQGPHGGAEELADPSCPAASQIGRTVAGAGVGSQLTYVDGKLYLAGPYHGDPISAVAVTPAVAGPFDAGVVVVREALRLNPVTHVGEVDGSASDPIPHILKGIPLNLRDLRVYADRPRFTLNATSCDPFAAHSTIWGDGTTLQPAGETPVGLSSRYQAAGCASLGFKPKVAIKLHGGTLRGDHPALRAVVTPRPGDANFSHAVVTLPHSAFLDQAHIKTICTRVQFAAGSGNGSQCPPGSVYGQAKAWSPLLDEPLAGQVFLRSSSHNLPDLVIALHGLVDIDLAARIDSVHGGIRSSFSDIPDAPVSRFILSMRGGGKGLIINSTDLCLAKHRAKSSIEGQNGKVSRTNPVVRAVKCRAAHR